MTDDGEPEDDKGRIVGGRYRLLERIGSGVTGTVWRAHDEVGEREVAVKRPHSPDDPDDEEQRRAAHRLYREARAAARVDHPSAVAIHDVVMEEDEGRQDALPWIVMESVRGESLDEVLRRGPLTPTEAARIGLAVLGALRAAHAVGIVHRDVKPTNVLLAEPDRVVLTDFGIADTQGEEAPVQGGGQLLVDHGEFVAPERTCGLGAAGPAADLWSLGVLLYAAVEGRAPGHAGSADGRPEPKEAGPLGPLLVRLLERDPERRPSATEVAAVLEAVAEGRTPPAPGPRPRNARSLRSPRGQKQPRSPRGPRRRKAEPSSDDPHVASSAEQAAAPLPAPPPQPSLPRRPLHSRPLPLTLLTLLLAGAAWLGTSFVGEPDSGASTERSGSSWVAHPEPAMGAVLSLPAGYRETARQGSGGGREPRVVVYSAGPLVVRLTQWDRAPASPAERAAQAGEAWSRAGGGARTLTTVTSFRGQEAVLADTTRGPAGRAARVLELFVRTDDRRLYELRVDMPKGTPDEERGAAVFRSARDRLRVGEH
ncbi:serine/threonine-protein kinase [Streptomyces sp. NPDC102395]|uniref:serine/threonine-protein kinase n=1 Tax=Streptomyces sp. NPDC102395 TaxID=3366168 RepID=UPI003816C872